MIYENFKEIIDEKVEQNMQQALKQLN